MKSLKVRLATIKKKSTWIPAKRKLIKETQNNMKTSKPRGQLALVT